jgi:hypothetical protein
MFILVLPYGPARRPRLLVMDIPRMGLPDRLASRLSMAEQHDLLRKLRPSRRSVLVAGAAGADLRA